LYAAEDNGGDLAQPVALIDRDRFRSQELVEAMTSFDAELISNASNASLAN